MSLTQRYLEAATNYIYNSFLSEVVMEEFKYIRGRYMEHYFDLPVSYEGQEIILKGRLATFGYTYKSYIIINGQEFVFERDDNQQFRMISEPDTSSTKINTSLIEAIIRTLESLYDRQ